MKKGSELPGKLEFFLGGEGKKVSRSALFGDVKVLIDLIYKLTIQYIVIKL